MSAELHTVPPSREWRWLYHHNFNLCTLCGCSLLFHRHQHAQHCFDCVDTMRPWQTRAIQMVGTAVKCGMLPKLDGSVQCVDCGSYADHYDHRDYGKPLEVEPVCRRCNFNRGTATFPGDKRKPNARVAELEQRVSA